MSDAETLMTALDAAGLPPNRVHLSAPPTPDAPAPPEGCWVVVPTATAYVVGGVGRGRFAGYAPVATIEEAADLVVRLLLTRPPTAPAPDEEVLARVGAATARAIRERTAQRGGAAGSALLAPGDLLDLLGPETGHHVYALGTPYPERAQPPTEAGEYHRYQVQGAIPDAVEGLAAPWFEQPGGGAMVVLTRPVRWYLDQQVLVELE